MKARFKILWIILAAVIVLLAAPEAAKALLPRKLQYITRSYCTQCGLVVREESEDGVVAKSYEETELHKWVALNIGTACNHTWKMKHSTSLNYVSVGGAWKLPVTKADGSYFSPPILHLAGSSRVQLDQLHLEGKEGCRQYISEQMKSPDQ